MNDKYFKLKLLLAISLIFSLVGGIGSGFLVANMYENARKYVSQNINISTQEIYRSKNKIEVLDLSMLKPDKIVIERSDDGENSVKVVYNTKAKIVKAEYDGKYPEKLNIVEVFERYKNNQYSIFNAVEKEINDVIARRNYKDYLDTYGNTAYDEIVYVKLTDATQLLVNGNLRRENFKVDESLVKRELDFKYYSNSYRKSLIWLIKGNFHLKGYSDSEYANYPHEEDGINIKLETEKMEELKLKGDFFNFHLNGKNVDNINIFVSASLPRDSKIEIIEANNVEVVAYPKYDIKYVIKYKDGDSFKEYVIPAKSEPRHVKTIVIDAKTVNYNNGVDIIKIK